MYLIERLERRVRELDQMTRTGGYNQQAADDRELLLEAVKELSFPCLKIKWRERQPFRFDDDK